MTFLGFRFVTFVCDQVVKQYVMCEKIIACMKSFAASIVKCGLMCLRLDRLNYILLATVFMFFKCQV